LCLILVLLKLAFDLDFEWILWFLED